MIKQSKRLGALALLALLATIVLGACSSGGATASPSTGTSAAPSEAASEAPASEGAGGVTGSITVSGSSTVEPISTAVAEAFKAANPDFNFTIEGPGTGDGFKRFCAGETDISDASRKIKPEGEADVCATAGIEYVELKIAYDGITVMTSPDNDSVECLSFADLYSLLGPESTGFANWTDAQALAKELGSNTTFPALPLTVTAPGEESGTYDSFLELVIAGITGTRDQESAARLDYVSSANDNVIVDGIAGQSGSLGWVGFAFAEENKDKVKEVAVSKDPNGSCVSPTQDTIADGSYPISRSLYIYVNKAKLAENPTIGAYVDYYLTAGTISTVLETVPYVNLPDSELDATRTAWEAFK